MENVQHQSGLTERRVMSRIDALPCALTIRSFLMRLR